MHRQLVLPVEPVLPPPQHLSLIRQMQQRFQLLQQQATPVEQMEQLCVGLTYDYCSAYVAVKDGQLDAVISSLQRLFSSSKS